MNNKIATLPWYSPSKYHMKSCIISHPPFIGQNTYINLFVKQTVLSDFLLFLYGQGRIASSNVRGHWYKRTIGITSLEHT